MDDQREVFRERVARLTPQEWRVLALVIEGHSTQSACESIGIAPGTFESHKQAIRRKLGVPRGRRLEPYLKEFAGDLPIKTVPRPGEAVATTAPTGEDFSDRRIRWLLRVTIDEVTEVARNAEMRAQILGQTVRRIPSADVAEADREVEDLQFLAGELRLTADRLLKTIRERNLPGT